MATVARRFPGGVVVAMAILSAERAAAGDAAAPLSTARAVADSCLRPGPYPPVSLEAVVIGRYPHGSLVIRDATGVTFVHGENGPLAFKAAAGDRVRVRGLVFEGLFSNGVRDATVETLASGPRPEPRRVGLSEFLSGGCYHDLIALAGVVRSVRHHITLGTILGIDVEGRTVEARCLPSLPEAAVAGLIDAEVEVVGFGAGEVGPGRHLLRPFLRVLAPQDVRVIRPAPADPFAAEPVPLGRLPRLTRSGHRVKVVGVAAARGGLGGGVFVAADGQGLFVEPAVIDDAVRRIAPGDRVEAVGFVSVGPVSLYLGDAVVRVTGTAAPPPLRQLPSSYSLDTLDDWQQMFSDLWQDSLPIEIEMHLVSRVERVGAVELVGTNGPRAMTVRCVVPGRLPAAAGPGSVVAARGVYRVTATDRDQSRPLPDAIDLWADSAAAVRLLRQPPLLMRPGLLWWLVGLLAACVAAAAAAIAWVVVLRLQVRRQVDVIEGQLQTKAVFEERQRIAREFHDSLEQDLAVMALRLEADAGEIADPAARQLLDQQRTAVLRLQDESHQFVWDLRDAARAERPLAESLRTLVDDLRHGSPADITLEIDGLLHSPPLAVRQNLLRIVRESVANAVAHAHAATISVTASAAAGRLRVTVCDDGEGCDVAACERKVGHFGLRGMRERAWRMGADFEIVSRPRSGTRVAVAVDAAPTGGQPHV